MVKLVLYGLDASPPVRAVKLTLAALQLPYDYKIVNILNKEQYSEEYLKKNPLHTVPLLEDGDTYITDSHAIMAYLVSKYGKVDSLYPKDLAKRALVDQSMYFEAGVVFATALRSMSKLVLFQGKTEVPQERIDAIIDAYNFVEAFLKDQNYIAGNQVTIADFSLITTINCLVVFKPIDAAKYPRLSAWIKRLEQLPYYAENNNPGAEEFAAAIKSKPFKVVA